MAIEIKVKKIVRRGVKLYEVIGIKGVMLYGDLPRAYTDDSRCIYHSSRASGNGITGNVVLHEGDICEETEIINKLDRIREAGMLLRSANKAVKEIEKTWNGTETFII